MKIGSYAKNLSVNNNDKICIYMVASKRVLTTSCVVVNSLTVHPLSVFSYTDHFAISFDLPCNVLPAVKSTKPCYVFDFCKADYEGITSFMLDFDFSVIFKSSDIEYVYHQVIFI